MSTTKARSAQGTKLQVRTGYVATKVVSAISKANPAVVTTTVAHGLVTGDVVDIAAVVGMTEINGESRIIKVLTATTFEMTGLDSLLYTAYVSGGTARPYSFSDLCEITNFQPSDPGSTQIDVTTVCSTAKEFVSGLSDEGTATMQFNYSPLDAGLAALNAIRDVGATDMFRLIVPGTPADPVAWYRAGKASVQALSPWPTVGPNAALQGNGSLKFSGKSYGVTA